MNGVDDNNGRDLAAEPLTSTEPERKEPELNMNNFYMNLPGGWHRELLHSHDELSDEAGEKYNCEKQRLFSAIDTLLATEFCTINIKAVLSLAEEAKKTRIHIENDENLDDFSRDALIRINKKRNLLIKRILEPLFKRLLEMGFERDFLIS